MPTRDIASDLTPQSAGTFTFVSNDTKVGAAIDTLHYDSGYLFYLAIYTYTDGTYVLSLQDSPDNSVWTDVPAIKLIQPDGAISLTAEIAAGDEIKRIGAFDTERYVRLQVVGSAITTGMFSFAFCVKKREGRPERI